VLSFASMPVTVLPSPPSIAGSLPAPDTARDLGIAAVAVGRSHHFGVAGHPVERLARDGLIGLAFANAPAAMAPWGGKRALMGTNPIAFAAPREDGDPLVVDLSLSRVARGKVMIAQKKGEPIPEGWALDATGAPTTDADAAMKGTMIPAGQAKGAALALMVELLCAGLTGSNFAYEASSLFDAEGPPPGLAHLILVLDPARFGPHFPARAEAMFAAIEAEEGARLPGARRFTERAAGGDALDRHPDRPQGGARGPQGRRHGHQVRRGHRQDGRRRRAGRTRPHPQPQDEAVVSHGL
jgi:(2R)-3-sulfolactate dehydrogenase (NADP+)